MLVEGVVAIAAQAPHLPTPIVMEGATRDDFAAVLAGPTVALERIAHVLHAHRLAGAESFTELMSLARMTGVEHHAYQMETVRRVLRALRGRALLADEVGLGKTIEALMVLLEYQLRGMAARVLVLVPPPLVAQWVGELASKAGIAARSTADDGAGDALWRGDGVVVASLATARMQRTAALVQAEPWDLVIVDEAHRVKNRATASWKLVNELRSRFLLLLTATPIESDLEELYHLVTLLQPGQFATLAQFRSRFVDTRNPSSPRNREALRRLLGEVMVRNTRASCGLQLPPRYVSTVVVEPDEPERALYDEVAALVRAAHDQPGLRRSASLLLLEAGSSPAAVRSTIERLLRGADAAARRALAAVALASERVVDTRKGRALVEAIRGGAVGVKLLVFTRYRATAAWLDALLTREGIVHAVVHGGLSGDAKQAALAGFRDQAQVLISTDVGSEGHNLQHCHRLVNFDLPWNPMVIEQRIGRLHRFGQTEEVEVVNLCARGSMEERILAVLHDRVRLFELVVGEMDMVVGNLTDDGDLEDRLLSLCAASEGELTAGLDRLGDELLRARGRYDEVRALDAALFGEDFEA